MADMLNMIMLFLAGAVMSAPLMYGVATLRGMQHKTLYPLLRVTSRDGKEGTIQIVHTRKA